MLTDEGVHLSSQGFGGDFCYHIDIEEAIWVEKDRSYLAM